MKSIKIDSSLEEVWEWKNKVQQEQEIWGELSPEEYSRKMNQKAKERGLNNFRDHPPSTSAPSQEGI